MATTIVLADDHQIVRQGLSALLKSVPDLQLLGEASNGLETIRLVERRQPDVLVVDLMMPGLNGMDVIRHVLKRYPCTQIVVLSMHSNEAYVVEALRAGASAYVVKEAGADELVTAIRAAARGERYFSPPISEEAINEYLDRTQETSFDPYDTLTTREREVLHLTAEGHSGNAISERLYISPRTVESHRMNLMRKLGVRNQKELIRYAVERGILNKG